MSFSAVAESKHRSGSRSKFKQSECDEGLFGERKKSREPDPVPQFEPPWVDNGKTPLKKAPRPLLFYCPTTPVRSTSQRNTSSPSWPKKRGFKPVTFSPSYVDESLFGRKPVEPEFDPPWVKESEKKRDRPILFDYSGALAFNAIAMNGERCSSRSSTKSTSERPLSVASRRSGSSTPVKRPWR